MDTQKRIQTTTVILSSIVALLGLIITIAWKLDVTELFRVGDNIAPTQFNTALLIFFSGIGTRCFIYNRKYLSLIIGAFIFIYSGLSFIQYIFDPADLSTL